jgi:hypothetical protein
VVWADSWELEDPDGLVYIQQWMEIMEHDGGGKPAVVATNYLSGYGKGSRKDGGTLDSQEFPINNEWNKTLRLIDLHSTTANTPTCQLFLENFLTPHSKPTPMLRTMEETLPFKTRRTKQSLQGLMPSTQGLKLRQGRGSKRVTRGFLGLPPLRHPSIRGMLMECPLTM